MCGAWKKEGIALGRETSADQILENLSKRYQPHKDKGNFNTRIRQMQAAFEETLEVFDTKDLEQKEDQELLARKCMSLAMECIRAHIFCCHRLRGRADEAGKTDCEGTENGTSGGRNDAMQPVVMLVIAGWQCFP